VGAWNNTVLLKENATYIPRYPKEAPGGAYREVKAAALCHQCSIARITCESVLSSIFFLSLRGLSGVLAKRWPHRRRRRLACDPAALR
jgi:hypothetical protein